MEKLNFENGSEKLLQTLCAIAPLNPALIQRMAGFLKSERYPRKTILLRDGEIARRVYFIVTGCARAWYHDEDGRERTSWFMRDGDVMISVYSFFTAQPSAETIELLETSELLSMTRRQLETLYKEFPEFNLHGRELTQSYYIQAEARTILMRLPKPRDRYHRLLQTDPDIFQRVPLTLIASYLGTTKETISRIRAGQEIDAHQL